MLSKTADGTMRHDFEPAIEIDRRSRICSDNLSPMTSIKCTNNMPSENPLGIWPLVRTELKRLLKQVFHHTDRETAPPPQATDYNSPPPEHWMGFFICHKCDAYFYPSYNSGPHPFGYLQCNNPDCRTIIAPSATTSTSIRRIDVSKLSKSPLPVYRLTGPHLEQIPHFTVCPCGLTHRARLYKPNLHNRWKEFPKTRRDELGVERLRRFVKQKDNPDVTLIEFEHVQCGCHRRYDVFHWQHFVICYDRVFHIDGRDAHGRWTEVRHKE